MLQARNSIYYPQDKMQYLKLFSLIAAVAAVQDLGSAEQDMLHDEESVTLTPAQDAEYAAIVSRAIEAGINANRAAEDGNTTRAADGGNMTRAIDGGNMTREADAGNMTREADVGNMSRSVELPHMVSRIVAMTNANTTHSACDEICDQKMLTHRARSIRMLPRQRTRWLSVLLVLHLWLRCCRPFIELIDSEHILPSFLVIRQCCVLAPSIDCCHGCPLPRR